MTVIVLLLAITQAATIAAFLMAADRRDKRHVKQIADLCQRIQSPEQAVVDHVIDQAAPTPPAVIPEFDDDWWAANEDRLRRLIPGAN